MKVPLVAYVAFLLLLTVMSCNFLVMSCLVSILCMHDLYIYVMFLTYLIFSFLGFIKKILSVMGAINTICPVCRESNGCLHNMWGLFQTRHILSLAWLSTLLSSFLS